jgi:hypothetical protein
LRSRGRRGRDPTGDGAAATCAPARSRRRPWTSGTTQALERRLEQLQYDWAAECAHGASRTVDPKQVQNRLALLRVFSDDVAALMQQETAEWVLEVQSNLLRLERERSDGTRARPGSVPLPGTAEP